MRARITLPVTVKTRIGIEDGEGGAARALSYEEGDYERLHGFIENLDLSLQTFDLISFTSGDNVTEITLSEVDFVFGAIAAATVPE